jgi:hypothetical protein
MGAWREWGRGILMMPQRRELAPYRYYNHHGRTSRSRVSTEPCRHWWQHRQQDPEKRSKTEGCGKLTLRSRGRAVDSSFSPQPAPTVAMTPTWPKRWPAPRTPPAEGQSCLSSHGRHPRYQSPRCKPGGKILSAAFTGDHTREVGDHLGRWQGVGEWAGRGWQCQNPSRPPSSPREDDTWAETFSILMWVFWMCCRTPCRLN